MVLNHRKKQKNLLINTSTLKKIVCQKLTIMNIILLILLDWMFILEIIKLEKLLMLIITEQAIIVKLKKTGLFLFPFLKDHVKEVNIELNKIILCKNYYSNEI